jgi:hypothetical protein
MPVSIKICLSQISKPKSQASGRRAVLISMLIRYDKGAFAKDDFSQKRGADLKSIISWLDY